MVAFTKPINFAVALSVIIVCYGLELSDNYRNFSHEIVNITALSLGKRDVVLSPFAMWNLLFTIALAVSGNTAKEVRTALKLSQESEKTLIKANKGLNKQVLQNDNTDVHYQSGTYMFWDEEFQINPEFKAIISYGLEIENEVLDFGNPTAAVATANSFIASSNAKFENALFAADFQSSRMILNSPTSFEGLWMLPFNVLDTTVEPFYSEKGEIIREVYMMNQRNKFPFTNINELGAFVLELPYGSNNKYCMLILLPSPGKTTSEVYQNLVHSFTLKDVFHKLNNDTKNYGLEDIDIKIPRFEIITNIDSQRALHSMGVQEIFVWKVANFNRATGKSIYVSNFEHRANINITETGTSASAFATAVFTDEIVPASAVSGTNSYKPIKSHPVYSPGFIANIPFIYYVMEKKTTTIIFGGAFSEFRVF